VGIVAPEIDVVGIFLHESEIYLKSPKNTPSLAVGLDGDEFGMVGASPTII
jgi:hypothetical protein